MSHPFVRERYVLLYAECKIEKNLTRLHAVVIFEVLVARPAGLVVPRAVAGEFGLATVGPAAAGVGPGVVGTGVHGDGGPLARVNEGCVYTIKYREGRCWGHEGQEVRRRSEGQEVGHR